MAEFTRAMRRTHTIYMPNMLPYHTRLLSAAFRFAGYRVRALPEASVYPKETFSTLSTDYCSPGVHIIGNMLAFVKDRERFPCGPENIAFLEPQSGGICKAGNLYHAMINSLRRSGFGDVPVISLNPHFRERHSGFTLGPRFFAAAGAAVLYGDLLMTLLLQIRPYEAQAGAADRLYRKWRERLYRMLSSGRGIFRRRALYRRIIADFRAIPVIPSDKVKAGITGEIYSKCAGDGNRHLERFLQEQDVAYRIGGFLNYLIYIVYTERKVRRYGEVSGAWLRACRAVQAYLEAVQRDLYREIRGAGFVSDSEFSVMERYGADIMNTEYNIGDGWLVAAEASDYIEHGSRNVLLCHPFTCLVSHVGSRGAIKKLKKKYPESRITSLEYDYYGSKAMLDSRVMMAISR